MYLGSGSRVCFMFLAGLTLDSGAYTELLPLTHWPIAVLRTR